MKIDKVLIVGGGIGGLTFGLTLRRVGIPFEIFERAPELKEVGAGVGLWANAVRVLDRLGVAGEIRALGQPLKWGEIANWKGRVLSRTDISENLEKRDAACYVVHRAELHAALARQLPGETIKTDHECTGFEADGGRVIVHFKNGATAEGTLVVGADGLNSMIRRQLWDDGRPRYSDQTCFRAVVETDYADTDVLREVQGAGRRFGLCPLGKGRLYWFAALNAAEGRMIPFADRPRFLTGRYAGWAYRIPELIAATAPEKIIQNDLVDRVPLEKWSAGRATLLGDAAHPTTPNFGQGACMAIEDALVLTRALVENDRLSAAFEAYEAARRPRTSAIVNDSWKFGRLARWENPLAVGLRETLVRLTPDSVTAKMLRRQIDYDAGPLPAAVRQ
ncbi:MAG: FAD-dependent monooxygenase [Acidobacteria bacterium]|nr:FAD-dependent monooxygenase [Acidobacteriota bacterium]